MYTHNSVAEGTAVTKATEPEFSLQDSYHQLYTSLDRTTGRLKYKLNECKSKEKQSKEVYESTYKWLPQATKTASRFQSKKKNLANQVFKYDLIESKNDACKKPYETLAKNVTTDGADAPVSKNVDEVEVSERTMHLESAKLTQWCENLLAHREPEKPGMSRLDSHTLAVK
jgi:Tfp pilus assembly protein PilO